MISKIREISFHPFLFSLYAVVVYLAINIDQVRPSEAFRPLVFVLVLALAAFGFFRIIRRDPWAAGILASMSLIIFFSYGHLYNGLKAGALIDASLVRHRYLGPVLIVLALAVYWLINRYLNYELVNTWMNLFALMTLIVPLWQITSFVAAGEVGLQDHQSSPGCEQLEGLAAMKPDVYLIILDAYTRQDVLEEMHGFDNSGFLRELEKRGFYIAEGSLSNYRHTEMSLSSLLNMNYLQDIPGSYQADSQNRMGLVSLIQDSRVRQEFECLGYQIVALETGVFWTEWEDADYFISRGSDPLERLRLFSGLSRFEAGFLETTAFRAIEDGLMQLGGNSGELVRSSDENQRDLVRFAFEGIEKAARLSEPKFVYVHILSPHPPFVFGRDGEPVGMGRFEDAAEGPTEDELLQAYVDQTVYLNSQVLDAVDEILQNSTTDPVIIIMGDHGWAERDAEDKLSILNAYRFPGGGKDVLYPTITPVNTFRSLFDFYFGTDYGQLPDISYFSIEADVYDFEVVPNSWHGAP